MSESGSGAVAANNRRVTRPVVDAAPGRTPMSEAANSLRYLSSLEGSGAYAVMQDNIVMVVWGAEICLGGIRE